MPSVDRRARLQSRQNACVTLEITPISPPPSAIAPALGGLAGAAGSIGCERKCRVAARCDHLAPTAALRPCASRCVAPTSMYSMKRSTMPACRGSGAPSARSRASLVPRLTTMLTLIGAEPGAPAASMPAQHVGHREVGIVHAAEDRVVQRVEADRHALQPGVLQRLRLAREQRAVGGQREVERRAVGRAQLGQHRRPAPRGSCAAAARRRSGGSCARRARRTARAVRVISSKLSSDACGRNAVVLVEHFLRHAVAAAEVAAVGHRDAQVAQRPAEACRRSRPVGACGCGRNARHRARRSAWSASGMTFAAIAAIVPRAGRAQRARRRHRCVGATRPVARHGAASAPARRGAAAVGVPAVGAARAGEALRPVARSHAFDAHLAAGARRVDELAVADVDADVREGALQRVEEHQVARLQLVALDRRSRRAVRLLVDAARQHEAQALRTCGG